MTSFCYQNVSPTVSVISFKNDENSLNLRPFLKVKAQQMALLLIPLTTTTRFKQSTGNRNGETKRSRKIWVMRQMPSLSLRMSIREHEVPTLRDLISWNLISYDSSFPSSKPTSLHIALLPHCP